MLARVLYWRESFSSGKRGASLYTPFFSLHLLSQSGIVVFIIYIYFFHSRQFPLAWEALAFCIFAGLYVVNPVYSAVRRKIPSKHCHASHYRHSGVLVLYSVTIVWCVSDRCMWIFNGFILNFVIKWNSTTSFQYILGLFILRSCEGFGSYENILLFIIDLREGRPSVFWLSLQWSSNHHLE